MEMEMEMEGKGEGWLVVFSAGGCVVLVRGDGLPFLDQSSGVLLLRA